jgi:glycine/D-amino acid oxidase-like deaminating enzyme
VSAPDVAVVGGGIVGCSLAALLAEGGAQVRLYEREAIAAAASGRNSGVLQHPLDEALTGLHVASLALYDTLGHGFELPAEPAGLLVVSADRAALEADLREMTARFPALAPEWLEGRALARAEPALADGLAAYRLATGRPVPPAAAARAWAERARAAGAQLRIGAAVERVDVRDSRAAGVVADGSLEPAGAVAVAAGPWTPAVVDPGGNWQPIAPLWGVVAEVRLAAPPVHVLEQAGVEDLTSPAGGAGSIFSTVSAGGVSAVGSTFLAAEPDAAATAPLLLERGARFVPALAQAAVLSTRACPRPQSLDGRPLLGSLDGIDGLHVASGHGPWGISLGPGSAQLVADGLLGRDAAIPPELAASRFGTPASSA